MKIQIEQVDLLAPWPAIAMRDGYYAVRVLVRAGTVPIGDVFVRPVRTRAVTPRRLQRRIARKYAQRIIKLLATEQTPELDGLLVPEGAPQDVCEAFANGHGQQSWPTPGATVAVYTQGKEALLAACIFNLRQLDYPSFEILVVDSGNDPVPTRDVAEKLGVRYVRCLSTAPARARNAAIEQARNDWVAFIDDDCRPERNWLKELVRPVAQDPNCRCVCGMVQPARLDSTADIAFELHRGLAQRFDEVVVKPAILTASSTRPAPLWHLGSAANLLVHKQFTQLAGGFDTRLAWGEEADLFYRALRDDYTVHYTPRAIVHHHRTWTRKTLRQHVRTAAVARAGYHVQRVARHGDLRSLLELAWHRPKLLVRELIRAMSGKTKFPWSMLLVELRGTLAGPWVYAMQSVRRRWKSRRVNPSATKRLPRDVERADTPTSIRYGVLRAR